MDIEEMVTRFESLSLRKPIIAPDFIGAFFIPDAL